MNCKLETRATRLESRITKALSGIQTHLREVRVALKRFWGILRELFAEARKEMINQIRTWSHTQEAQRRDPRGRPILGLIVGFGLSIAFWITLGGLVLLVRRFWLW